MLRTLLGMALPCSYNTHRATDAGTRHVVRLAAPQAWATIPVQSSSWSGELSKRCGRRNAKLLDKGVALNDHWRRPFNSQLSSSHPALVLLPTCGTLKDSPMACPRSWYGSCGNVPGAAKCCRPNGVV